MRPFGEHRVMGIASIEALCFHILPDSETIWELDESFTTSLYSLDWLSIVADVSRCYQEDGGGMAASGSTHSSMKVINVVNHVPMIVDGNEGRTYGIRKLM
uniref:Uncharacterized protein n=1 Tax=Cannabis sativa TaxID=3483 RepID=A0A803NQA2_CANSA